MEIVDRVAAMGYRAIEWRGGPSGHVPRSTAPAALAGLRDHMTDRGVSALALTTYGSLVEESAGARARETDGLRRDLDTAAALGAPYARVFVGIPGAPASQAELHGRAAHALGRAIEHAAAVKVDIALEAHDLHARSASIRPILEEVASARVGAIWDVGTATDAGEEPDETLEILGPWIRYVQLNDGRPGDGEWQSCMLGRGVVPLARALDLLRRREPMPPLCLEYPRAWDPALEPAEVAFPAALAHIRSILGTLTAGDAPDAPRAENAVAS